MASAPAWIGNAHRVSSPPFDAAQSAEYRLTMRASSARMALSSPVSKLAALFEEPL